MAYQTEIVASVSSHFSLLVNLSNKSIIQFSQISFWGELFFGTIQLSTTVLRKNCPRLWFNFF